jgi:5-methylthioribose kinase
MAEFNAFDVDSVREFVGAHDTLRAIVGGGKISAREIGDGNLNLAFVFETDQASQSTLLLKQALPYLRVAGEGWPLTRERMRFETESLLFHNKIAPGLVPQVYAYDLDNSWVAMEFLADHDVLRHAIKAGVPLRDAAREIGAFSAKLTYHSSEMSLTAQEKRARAQSFTNPELCNLQEQFVFTNPFFDSEENTWIDEIDADVQAVRRDPALKRAIAHAKSEYMAKSQALLHGDLHTGSVMVNRSGDTAQSRIIDPEFAFYGPVAYDLGTMFANFAIGALVQTALGDDRAVRRSLQSNLVRGIADAWRGFVTEIEHLWTLDTSGDLARADYWNGDTDGFTAFRSEYLLTIAADCGAQGGCELLRRCMGIVSVSELEAIENLEHRGWVERQIIAIARSWLLEPALKSADLGQAVDHLILPVLDAVSRLQID